jgi:hypothetical protein
LRRIVSIGVNSNEFVFTFETLVVFNNDAGALPTERFTFEMGMCSLCEED